MLAAHRSPPPRAGLTVDVFIPTYNESVELVRETLIAACAMDYPHQTWLLDDGRRAEMRELAEQLGCRYLAREGREHAKAGNLNHAVAHSDGQVIAVFDADHAPPARLPDEDARVLRRSRSGVRADAARLL